MQRVLVTGACGQIGTELIYRLSSVLGSANVYATDIQKPSQKLRSCSVFKYCNVMDSHMISRLVVENNIDTIFHMAAILSATGEQNPHMAYEVNLSGLMNVLEVARRKNVTKVIMPSTIAVFGSDAPKQHTPDDIPLNPGTMYGVTKVAGEKMLQYYHSKYGLDTRSIRYPGIISSETMPGGGTTDFAVDLYIKAATGEKYSCYIDENTALPFMYMPDAIEAIFQLSIADNKQLSRRVYNVHSMSLTPADLVNSIQTYFPKFNCDYKTDFRQSIAESWPASINDQNARNDWQWSPKFNLDAMTKDMLKKLKQRISV